MKKCFILFVFLISFFSLSQNANAGYYSCDSRPNAALSPCSECGLPCDYPNSIPSGVTGYSLDVCRNNGAASCPSGTVPVDCQYNSLSWTYYYVCKNLVCGDAGVQSGNTCVQDSSLDIGCVDTVPNSYAWVDNTNFLSCDCVFTIAATINQYTKKADGTLCTKNGNSGKCDKGVCITIPVLPACSDGTPENSCCGPGTKCLKDTITGLYSCTKDSSCPTCLDGDAGKDTTKATTCKDTAGGLCDAFQAGGSKCTDTCASNGAVNEYYCSNNACKSETITCGSSSFCTSGKCDSGSGGPGGGTPPPGGGTNPGSGGCSWFSTTFNICSSGCPASYPNQQQVCCGTNQDRGCNGGPACASYNPTVGETPCCYATGYKTCTKQETCTATGCQNVCTTADKTSDLYCSKCNSCQDGILNCGEPAVDVCSKEPCTITTTTEYVKFSYSYCRDVCRNDGATCVAVMGSSGQYYPQGCAEGWIGNCKCSKTTTDFNPKTCSDGFQNCAETCVDGGGNCITGKETDNSYLVTFDYTQPAELSGTSLYSDANSWNCMDGLDNDKDCLIDCKDPECSL